METMNSTSKVKQLRLRKGFSQEELAERSGLSLRTIQRIENGETDPRGDSLKRLSEALGVTPDDLVDWASREDKSYLMLLILSSLSFILFPILGVVVPLVLWVSKKDKIKDINNRAKEVLNFQLTWLIIFLIGMAVCAFIGASMIERAGDISPVMITRMTRGFATWIGFMYAWNMVFTVINAVRVQGDKPSFYFPLIRFL